MSNVQKSAIGAGTYGFFNNVSDFMGEGLDVGYTSPRERASNRAKALDNVRPSHSGDEGIYWENLMKQMAQDTGADNLTDPDKLSFGQGMDYVNSELARNGGLIKGAKGMQTGSEHYLTKAQEGMLVKAGYKLKRLY